MKIKQIPIVALLCVLSILYVTVLSSCSNSAEQPQLEDQNGGYSLKVAKHTIKISLSKDAEPTMLIDGKAAATEAKVGAFSVRLQHKGTLLRFISPGAERILTIELKPGKPATILTGPYCQKRQIAGKQVYVGEVVNQEGPSTYIYTYRLSNQTHTLEMYEEGTESVPSEFKDGIESLEFWGRRQ